MLGMVSSLVGQICGMGGTKFADGVGTTAMLNGPRGLALDSAGAIYLADTLNNRIRVISTSGTVFPAIC